LRKKRKKRVLPRRLEHPVETKAEFLSDQS
jgi:hypothetical protein